MRTTSGGDVLPKYLAIGDTIRKRISDGTYPVGELLPSEADFVREFGAARATVVRALGHLVTQGWLRGIQGKGRLVLGRPKARPGVAPARVRSLLDAAETVGARLVRVGPVPAPERVARLLAVSPGTRTLLRRRLMLSDDGMPDRLDSAYLPEDIARTANLGTPATLGPGLVELLDRAGLAPRQVTERISARLPSPEEAALLHVDQRHCLVTVLLAVRSRSGRPLLALECLIPVGIGDLEARFLLD